MRVSPLSLDKTVLFFPARKCFFISEKPLRRKYDYIKAEAEGGERRVKQTNDRDIISMLFDRNPDALGIIQRQFGRLIKRISLNIVNSTEEAGECLNDVLLDVWNTVPPAEPVSVSSYVCMLSRRRAIDRVRSQTAAKRNSSFSAVCSELAEAEDGLEKVLDGISINAVINTFLKKLSPVNREIFMSRYFDFEPVKSISERIHISENSVKTRLLRMRKKLRCELEAEGVQL